MVSADNILYYQLFDAMIYALALFKNRVGALICFLCMFGGVLTNTYNDPIYYAAAMIIGIAFLSTYKSTLNNALASVILMKLLATLTIFETLLYNSVNTLIIILQMIIVLIGEDDSGFRSPKNTNSCDIVHVYILSRGAQFREKYRNYFKRIT